jgi:glycosyltransferase involved in cell wall biosynthesis
VTLPLGTGVADNVAPGPGLPVSGRYVLFVSTIEARKNHVLLFRVWQRLLQEMPPEAVPTLVFAGRVGWLVDDLMQQIVNTDHLSGRLVVVDNASDSELAALYRGCLFTVYPSLFEGWGLPLTESLAFGKPCLASDRTALPEAGGNLARYVDPDDLHGWYVAIRDILADPAQLTPWTERIRREFRPVTWSETASALLTALSAQPSSAGAVSALAASCSGSS